MNATITHNLVQGSPAWHAHRAAHFNASDAAAMLGLSPYKTRDQLLAEKASGITQDVDEATQRRFDQGHVYEAQARPWAEELIGEELYPVTMSRVVDGLKLSASVDGLTLGGEVAWEHKTLSAALSRVLPDGEVPVYHRAQLEQIMLVSGADRVLFMASAGKHADMQFAWYESIPVLRQQLIDGWQQFAKDLAAYQPSAAQPAPVAEPIGQLPALLVEIEGRVVSTNLDRFESAARALIGSIKTELETDQDFANAEATVKYCKDAEDRLDLVKKQALAQTASIDDVFRVMDGLREQLRATRLSLDKQVKARKEAIRDELVTEFYRQMVEHVNALNAGNGEDWLDYPVRHVLGDAIKGLKSIASCRNALAAKCSELRTDLSAAACRLARNREMLKHEDRDWYSLFPDFHSVGTRQPEDFDALSELRIRRHREAEAAILAELQAQAESARAAAAAQAQAAAATPSTPPAAAPVEVTQPPAAEPYEIPEGPIEPEGLGVLLFDLTEVAAFLKERDFGNQHSHVRSILVEFCKFVARRREQATPKVAA